MQLLLLSLWVESDISNEISSAVHLHIHSTIYFVAFLKTFESVEEIPFNPLSPNIHIQILQTDLYTFLLRIS